MSWYVRRLLLERDNIKSTIKDTFDNGTALELEENPYQMYQFDSDTYMDLLAVENKLKELINKNMVSDDELEILEYMLSNRTASQIERDEGINYHTILKKFNNICSRIAFHLGSTFTNDGYIYYLSNKYNLSKEQIQKLKIYMNNEE